jgi:hypothetical protein
VSIAGPVSFPLMTRGSMRLRRPSVRSVCISDQFRRSATLSILARSLSQPPASVHRSVTEGNGGGFRGNVSFPRRGVLPKTSSVPFPPCERLPTSLVLGDGPNTSYQEAVTCANTNGIARSQPPQTARPVLHFLALGRKRDRSNSPERPSGCCAQIGPVPFSASAREHRSRTSLSDRRPRRTPRPRRMVGSCTKAISVQELLWFGDCSERTVRL